MELIKALWRGDISLAKTFWIFGFAVNLLLNFTSSYILLQQEIILSTIIGRVLLLLLVVFCIIYNPFILIAIWRSAKKYKGSNVYGILAKIMVIIGWGGYLRSLDEFAQVFSRMIG